MAILFAGAGVTSGSMCTSYCQHVLSAPSVHVSRQTVMKGLNFHVLTEWWHHRFEQYLTVGFVMYYMFANQTVENILVIKILCHHNILITDLQTKTAEQPTTIRDKTQWRESISQLCSWLGTCETWHCFSVRVEDDCLHHVFSPHVKHGTVSLSVLWTIDCTTCSVHDMRLSVLCMSSLVLIVSHSWFYWFFSCFYLSVVFLPITVFTMHWRPCCKTML